MNDLDTAIKIIKRLKRQFENNTKLSDIDKSYYASELSFVLDKLVKYRPAK